MRSLITRIEVHGARETYLRFKSFSSAVQSEAGTGLWAEGRHVIRMAQRDCPTHTGALRASGHVDIPKIVRGGLSVAIGFGGPAGVGNVNGTNMVDVDYALIVHEDTSMHHTHGHAHYLTHAVNEALPGIRERMNTRIMAEVEKVTPAGYRTRRIMPRGASAD